MSGQHAGEPGSRAAVLGSPVAHSLSPVLHRAAYSTCGLSWDYSAIECDEGGLPTLLARVRVEPGWRGLSLTMPLKIVAVSLVDSISAEVAVVGALNTIVVSEVGGLVELAGHNTDIAGVRAAVLEGGVKRPLLPVVLGAGGTARAALAALAGLGSPAVVVVARDVHRAALLTGVGERAGIAVRPVAWSAASGAINSADVVVATTPKGATDGLCGGGWPTGVPLVDVLYDPWPTALAAYAAAHRASIVGGMAVLTHQAGAAFTLMTGLPAPTDAIRSAGERALAGRKAAVDR